MAAVMDLDLNCSPPSPDPAAHDELNRSMLRQEHTFRDQVKDLRRLYWTHNNLKVTDVPPLWNHSSDALLYARHPSHMVDLNNTHNPDGFSQHHEPGLLKKHHEPGSQAPRFGVNGISWENFHAKGSIPRKPDSCSVQGRSRYNCVIDLEKPATLDDDDVEIVSSPAYINYASHNGGLSHYSQCVPLESSLVTHAHLSRDQNTHYVTSGSIGSSDTPGSLSPARAKNMISGRMFIDLNVAQEDDLNFSPDPSKLVCSTSTSSAPRSSVEFCNNLSKTFLKGRESSIGSSKGSSITVAKTIVAPDSSREAMAAGIFHDNQSHKTFSVEESYPIPRKNIHCQHVRHIISGLDSQGRMVVPQKVVSVCSNGGSNSCSGLAELGDNQATIQAAVVVHRDPQEDTITVISDDEVGGIDLNVVAESTDLAANFASSYLRKLVNNDGRHCLAQNEDQQNIPSIECPSIRNQDLAAKSTDSEDVQSPVSGVAIDRSVLIPETPQGRDYACPRLRSSSNGASVVPEAVSIHETEIGEDEKSAATAAETLVSIFATSSAWLADGHESSSETDAEDGRHEPTPSLNSFEESILGLEDMEDDGKSFPARAPDKDGPSCGIKLKRGRGLRDFQREILPGLVSLARHEICDDLHAIGYEIRKTRSRKSPGDECSPPTRMRLPRRCSTAWNR